jgi:hypothetical protein
MTNDCFRRLMLSGALLLLPATLVAQSVSTGSITGVARDASGGVLPGVTVEAVSPALIEKMRSAVTDMSGVYRITDLRPGTYSVTFTLAGFNTVRRENIELTTGFTAVVNADLAVGNVSETITVSGATPVVDTQNVSQQVVLSRSVTENLPLGSGIKNYATLVPGAVYAQGGNQDVGGNKGEYSQNFLIHGGRGNDFQQLRDGMFFGTLVAAGNWMTSLNPATVAETTVVTSSGGAELESGGVLVNVVPRDGGNMFAGTFNANFSDPSLQSDNLTAELRARQITAAGSLKKRYDVGGGFGGPIKSDKLWFFASSRSWRTSQYYPGNYFNKTPGTLFYTADSNRPAYDNSYYKEVRGRVTTQVTSKDKINFSYGQEWNCDCASTAVLGTTSPESFAGYATNPSWQMQATWSRPATSRLLLEAGVVALKGRLDSTLFGAGGEAGGSSTDPFVLDQSRNYGYGGIRALGLNGGLGTSDFQQANERFSASYVTGSHAVKVGAQYRSGATENYYYFPPSLLDRTYVFANATTPSAVTLWAAPFDSLTDQTTFGFYAQDQWTLKRLTVNLGVRYDYLNGSVPAFDVPAGTWVPARHFDAVDSIPTWKNWSPRLGAAYNLFGSGKTAVKGYIGRFVLFESATGITGANAPANRIVNSTTRSWADNGDYIPQDSELGPLLNSNFGKLVAATTYSPDLLTGNRPYQWQSSLQVQQELSQRVALTVGYFRTWYGNIRATNNLAVSASDFTPYCVNAPLDPLLPGGGGQKVCGFYDINPNKVGQSNQFVDLASKYGDPSEHFNGVDVSVTARLGGGRFVQAGLATGSTTTDNCYANDKPQLLPDGRSASDPRTDGYCKVSSLWSGSTQFKAAIVLPIWYQLQASANYQSLAPIPTAANASYSNVAIVPSLGRDLAACGSRTGAACTATVVANLVLANTYYLEPRLQQLDLRFSRLFRVGRSTIQPQLDIFNTFNSADVLGITTRLGPRYNVPTGILDPRLVKFGVNINF